MKHLHLPVLTFLLIIFIQACSKEKPEVILNASKETGINDKRKTKVPVNPVVPIDPVVTEPTTNAHKILVQNPGNNNNIQPNIQAAVDIAVAGDEIDLPEGQFVFNKSIVINKFISIKGIGPTRTVLYRSESVSDAILSGVGWEHIFKFDINSTLSSNIVISNLYLKSKKPCEVAGDGGSLAPDFGIKMINCVDFTITNCRFENFGNAAVSIQHDDNIVSGLLYRNEFFHNTKGPDGLGLGYGVVLYGANQQWISNPGLGTANFIFVEDNTFEIHRHAIAAAGCALYVFRYNKVINNNIGANSGQAIDAHEARQTPGFNYYSTRAVEIYNNQVVNTTFKDGTPIVDGKSAQMLVNNAILIRGGEAVIHDNYISGYRFAVGIINFEISGAQTYPVFTQIGYLSGLARGQYHSGTDAVNGEGDLFSWNNTFTPYAGSYSSSVFYNFQPEYFTQGRDYHLIAKPYYSTYTYPHPRRSI